MSFWDTVSDWWVTNIEEPVSDFFDNTDDFITKLGLKSYWNKTVTKKAKNYKKFAADVKTYFNPKEPKVEPDPQIALMQKQDDARKRNRRLGRAMLLTSRQPVTDDKIGL